MAIEEYDVVILGSGQGGKQLAWHLGRSGRKLRLSSGAGSVDHVRR